MNVTCITVLKTFSQLNIMDKSDQILGLSLPVVLLISGEVDTLEELNWGILEDQLIFFFAVSYIFSEIDCNTAWQSSGHNATVSLQGKMETLIFSVPAYCSCLHIFLYSLQELQEGGKIHNPLISLY